MRKRNATYDLDEIKAACSSVARLRMTRSAQVSALSKGYTSRDMVAVIQTITTRMFYKSMPGDNDRTVWQDVYHVPGRDCILYVKFVRDEIGLKVLSFKEKDDG